MAGIPETIGKYKIVSLVAKGGMGAVYKAIHPNLRRYVIIKKLTIRGNASVIERFKREAQILLDFNNPYIVHFFDYFQEGSSRYIVLEYVDGMSLDVLIKKRRYLSGPLALLVFLDAARALKYAHDQGVIHRDIKPGNILISKAGDIKLADFGIAASEHDEDEGLTREGMTLGTPSYMPPEQFENSKNVDKRADIYAMGVMLYEMVTGKKPFPGSLAPETINMIQKGRFVAARKLNPDIPPIISKLIHRMIRPDPRKRFKDMSIPIKIIEKFLSRYPLVQMRESLVNCMAVANFEEPVFKARTRKRVVFFLLAALSLAVLGSGYILWTNGFIHRTFLAHTLGSFKVAIRVPQAIKDQQDVFLKAEIFVNDRKDFPAASGADLHFLSMPDDGSSFWQFESNTVYLPAGNYRLKLICEQRIYWQSFRVETMRALQNRNEAGQVLSVVFDRVVPRELVVRGTVLDALSGRDLGSLAVLSVNYNNQWIPLPELESNTLRTGAIWRFRAEAPGYYPELFSLKVTNYQDELILRANLVPLAGKLVLNGPAERISLTLNGSKQITLGGEDMLQGSIGDFSGRESSWNLPAGRYELEATSKKSRARMAFTISPEVPIRLRLHSDSGIISISKE